MNIDAAPEFRVYAGKDVRAVVNANRDSVIAAVEAAYRSHHLGRSVNPRSTFLRFAENSRDRIIALPACYRSEANGATELVTGIKWIASFPGNIERGIPRASALLILNDARTGYPLACMEASTISAARTAASAVSALTHLLGTEATRPCTLAVIGTGVISQHILEFACYMQIAIREILVVDLVCERAAALARRIRESTAVPVRILLSSADAIAHADVVILATTAAQPHISDPALFRHNPIVLHISLRDLAPEVVLASANVVDDIDHCLTAQTSLHLTEMQVGHRQFVTTSLPAILCGEPAPARTRPIVFSPFGMGILDLAVGALVHRQLAGRTEPVADFFALQAPASS